MPGHIRTHRDGAIGWIEFVHPERRNAISVEMWRAIPAAVGALEGDSRVRVVVLRGAGDVAFVSGADISEFETQRTGGSDATAYEGTTAAAFAALVRCAKPVIAMIHGYCVGGGLALALAADLRYAAEDGVFAIPAARLGLGYHASGIQALMQLVGPAAAKEIFFTARRYPAGEALRMGILNDVFPKSELEERVREIAGRIAGNAPLTLRSVKLAVRELCRDLGSRDEEAVRASIATCFESEDYREGVAAFLEKRPPRFQGH